MRNLKTWLALGISTILVATMMPQRTTNAPSTPRPYGPLAAGNPAPGNPPLPTPDESSFVGQVTVSEESIPSISPALRDLPIVEEKPYDESMIRVRGEPFETGGELSGDTRPQMADPVAQEQFGLPGLAELAMPATTVNFDGMSNISGVLPPDTSGEVGPNHFVQMINSHLQIFNKSGQSLYGPVAINTLWAGFGGQCDTQNDGDPVVMYDQMADRWVITQFVASAPYGECIAVSTSPDPTGTYYRYFFQLSSTVFYDYPHLGVWPDGYYMGTNRFTSTYQGGSAHVFDRAKMLLGQPATFQEFKTGTSYGTLIPADMDGPTQPPAGAPNYFMSIGSTALRMWKFKVNWTTPSASTFTGPTNMTVAAYNYLCPTNSCVDQPSTNVNLDGLGDRLMFRVAYRNMGTHESLLASHSANAASSGTRAGVRWYEVRSPNGTPAIYQQGTYSPDTVNRWMGSIAMDKAGNIGLGFSASSSSIYPGLRYTGRLATDPLGQMPQGEGIIVNGGGAQTHTAARWGDYAQMSVDPVDDCTFWFTSEYMATTSQAGWKTRVGAFKFPSCTSSSATATPTSVPPTATSTPLPTNTPTTGPTPTKTNTPVPPTNTPTSVPPTATSTPGGNALGNPGFESGPVTWVQYSSAGYQVIDTSKPHAGAYGTYQCGYNSCTEYVEQTVTVPANGNLSYWWHMTSSEGTTTAYDYLYVRVYSTSNTLLGTVRTWSNKNTRGVWAQDTVSLAAYAGQTVKVRFMATTDSSIISTFYVDDTSLQ